CDVFISCDDDNFRDVAGLVSDHGTLKIKESVVEIELKACGKVRGLTSNGEPMEFTDSVININIDGYPSTLFKSEIIGIKTNGVKFEITTYGFILINVNESGGNCIMSYVDTYDTERVDPIDEKDSKITLINASITTPASFVRKPLNFETYVGYDKKYQCFETIYAIEASEKPVSQLIIK
ncbi:MAG: hypothetical protein HUJ61_06135, partial [Bacilli bacterium]|nr:hypothetical protein [Bacilli bacterium]